MATLNAKSTSLEINFPYARSDAVIYEFRLQWLGQNIISSAARFNDAPEDASIPFQAWDHKKDRLCDTIDRALSTNSPQHWEPIDPFAGICIVPGSVDAFRFSYWISADGQEDLAKEMNSFSQKESGEDEFTVMVGFDSNHHLIYEDGCGGSTFGATLFTERAPLKEFAHELRRQYDECQKNRKMPPSGDDTLWRMIH